MNPVRPCPSGPPAGPDAIASLEAIARDATRAVFLTGKGGVGKTSVACAVAVLLADAGRRVLLVSTDPASNLDEVLGVTLDGPATRVPGVPNLHATNVDPVATARAYRERLLAPYRGVLPAAAIASVEEQLSGACTVEVAAFEHFARLLAAPDATADFDHVVFDTAPTGHTLRLLELPAAWTRFLDASASGASCLGPLSALAAQRGLYAAARDALADPATTTVILVARPDAPSLHEADRARGELEALGVRRMRFVLNGVFTATDRDDPIALDLEARGREAVDAMPGALAILPRVLAAARAPRGRRTRRGTRLRHRHARPFAHRRSARGAAGPRDVGPRDVAARDGGRARGPDRAPRARRRPHDGQGRRREDARRG